VAFVAPVAGRTVARKAAAKGASRKAATRRAPAGDPNLERDRAAIQKIKDARAPEPATDQDAASTPAPAPTSSGAGAWAPAVPASVSTGSGFLLGVVAWGFGLAYLRGGWDGVRRFGAAKFLNKVEG
jgi:hypothetical protein